MTFTVRRARTDEYQHIGQLTLAGFDHLQSGAKLPEKERLSLLIDAQGRNEQGVLLVAEGTDGKLLGTASVFPHGVAYARQARVGEAELRLLAVLPEARKRSLGWALLEEGANIAKGWGAERLVLDTASHNLRSQRLYLRFGFEHRPERDVHREPPKVSLAVFSLDLSQRAEATAVQVTSPAGEKGAGTEIRDEAGALEFLRINPLVDGHNDLPTRLRRTGYQLAGLDRVRPEFHTDLVRLRKGGVGAQFWSVYVPSSLPEPEAAVATLEQIDAVHRLVAAYPGRLGLAYTAVQVRKIFASGRIASLLGAEGGHSIAGSPGVLRSFARLGLRYLTLTHNHNTAWADSATAPPSSHGLTGEGRSVVAALNRHGILVDLSHTAESVQLNALAHSTAPVIFSHSSAKALTDHPRNISDDVLQRLAANGGVAQVTFVPAFISTAYADWDGRAAQARADAGLTWTWPDGPRFGSPASGNEELLKSDGENLRPGQAAFSRWLEENPRPRVTIHDVADHIDHVREAAGAAHVGIGGDYDGVERLPEGLEDVSGYPGLFAELAQRGWSTGELASLAGGNVLRVLQAAEDAAEEPLWPRGEV
ncbi:GNAT family N-acetyltransferase [Arthrobacter bambusae]